MGKTTSRLGRIGQGALTVVATAAALLALDYWVDIGASSWLAGVGWSYLLVMVPTFLAASALGWVVGRLTVKEFRFVVRRSMEFFLLMRVVATMGGWFHGGWFAHLIGVVVMPLAPALGFWLGARLAWRGVEGRPTVVETPAESETRID